MRYKEKFSEAILSNVAKNIGKLLPGFTSAGFIESDLLKQKPIVLGETFEVWALLPNNTDSSDITLDKIAKQTTQWHHQILFNKKAGAFARSLPINDKDSDRMVVEICSSERAKKINDALYSIDKDGSYKDVRLLIAQHYQLYAFWLIGSDNSDSKVFVIDCPQSDNYCLKPSQLISGEAFINALSKQQQLGGFTYKNSIYKNKNPYS